MVWRLMPAALATSDSVIDDQSLLINNVRMPSRIDSRRSRRDASAYGTRGAGLLIGARVVLISRRWARLGRSRACDLDHLEVLLGRAAVGATPVVGDVVPASAGGDAVLGPALRLVVFESALHADEQLVCVTHVTTHLPSFPVA